METVRKRAPESIVFGLKSTKKQIKVVKRLLRDASGRRGRKFESCHLDQKKRDRKAIPFLLVLMTDLILVVASQQLQVRIRRPKIGELAHQAQGERIFAAGEQLVTSTKRKGIAKRSSRKDDKTPTDYQRSVGVIL